MPFPVQWIPVEPYRVCDMRLADDPAGLSYWVAGFRRMERVVAAIASSYPERTGADVRAFVEAYGEAMREEPLRARFGADLDVYALDRVRKEVELAHGFDDPYRAMKREVTASALVALPGLLDELDGLEEGKRRDWLVRGLMAGNLFDVGSEEAMHAYRSVVGDFGAARARVPARPWWRDDADGFLEGCASGRYREVGWFVDNAGSDICLGVLPLVRWLLGAGVRVVLAANAGAALNDVTVGELRELLEEVSGVDGLLGSAWGDGRLAVVSNGNDCPLLHLGGIPGESVGCLGGADVLLLHGMGRGLESNWSQRFGCTVVRTAVVKDPRVGTWLGAGLFDCVFRVESGAV